MISAADEGEAARGLSSAILVGRHDYVVRSVDAESGGERWNVTYAQLQQLSPQTLKQAAQLGGPTFTTKREPCRPGTAIPLLYTT